MDYKPQNCIATIIIAFFVQIGLFQSTDSLSVQMVPPTSLLPSIFQCFFGNSISTAYRYAKVQLDTPSAGWCEASEVCQISALFRVWVLLPFSRSCIGRN